VDEVGIMNTRTCVVETLLWRKWMKARANALLTTVRGHLLVRVGVLATLTMLLLTVVYVSTAWATTFTVTNTNDSGPGSLRAAIEQANANAGADKIVFADGVGTITLASMLPEITDTAGLVINGGGDVTVSGNQVVGVFQVSGNGFGEVKLALRNLTIADGAGAVNPSFGFREGGAISSGGTLEVANVTFSGNSARFGGAIYTSGFANMTVTNSTFSGNSADFNGGAIDNSIFPDQTTTVTNSTFSNNSANFRGGGIANDGPLKVMNTTFSNNSSGLGAGIYNDAVSFENIPIEVTNSTFFGNSGVGIYNGSSSVITVTNSTFFGNSSGTYQESTGTLTLSNTILANSLSGENCGGEFIRVTDGGYNIDSGTTCGFTQGTGSLSNTDPLLDSAGLQDNGGRTQTIALQPDSPAVDLVGQGACPPPTTDQRGIERPQGTACDSGAFELAQDTTPPRVISTVPKANADEVAPTANIRATFSEEMQEASVKDAFKLFKKGSTNQIAAAVTYDAATDTATLNPNENLRRGATYKAVVSTVAKDVVGNRLDQDGSTAGLQKKVWFFEID
jgi:predicted outer membrane repeat protein